jgi:hypothetical protein
LSAFCAERALPAGVFGPRDLAPLRRLASARALLTGTAADGAAPIRDMAVILWLELGADWRMTAQTAEQAVAKKPGV